MCREFGISRKTGYKIVDRYEECGLEGLTDRARRPYRYANQAARATRSGHRSGQARETSWGRRKIRVIEEFNNEHPREALEMKCPAEVYASSERPYLGIPEPHYPFHDKTLVVTNCGRLCLYRRKIDLSTCLAGQAVGIKEVDDGIWLVSFMDYDPGYIDLEEKTLQPLNNPFGPKVLPVS